VGLAQDVLVVAGLAGVAIASVFFLLRGAGQALEGFEFPKIELPGLPDVSIDLPDITFPTFEFPTIEFPTFEFPDFGDPFAGIADFFGGLFGNGVIGNGVTGNGGDFTDVGMAGARGERGGTPEAVDDGIEQVGEFMGFPTEGSVVADPIGIPFAVLNIEETQAEFQERSGAFVEALPEVTAFTSLPGAETDLVRSQLSRESEDFQMVLDEEARRSETIFAGLFGNVQNPDFGS